MVKVMVTIEATCKPTESFESCALTDGSYRLKAITPLASRIEASSNLTSGDQLSLAMGPKRRRVRKEKGSRLATQHKESPVNKADGEENRLRNVGHVASPRITFKLENPLAATRRLPSPQISSKATVKAEDRSAETNCLPFPQISSDRTGVKIEDLFTETNLTNQDISARRRRLDGMLINGVTQTGNGLDDGGVNTNLSLRGSEAHMVETKKVKFEPDLCLTQSLNIKEEHNERKETRVQSSEETHDDLCEEEDEAILQEIASGLMRQKEDLKAKLMLISERCQEVKEANDFLLEELEKVYGSDGIADLLARNPSSSGSSSSSSSTGREFKTSDVSTIDSEETLSE